MRMDDSPMYSKKQSFEADDSDGEPSIDEGIKKVILFTLNLNLRKPHNHDYQNSKKIYIIKQVYRDEQTTDFQVYNCITKAQQILYYAKIPQAKSQHSNIFENISSYSNFQQNQQFIQMVDELKNKQLSQLEDNIKNENSLGVSGTQKQQNQAAISWMKNMSENSSEFLDFYLQIYEIYKGLQQILMQQNDDEKQRVKGNFQNIVLLHQNENPNCDSLLHVSSFSHGLLMQSNYFKNSGMTHNLYINLTGENSQKNIDFWKIFHLNNKELSKFISFYPIRYNGQTEDKHQKQQEDILINQDELSDDTVLSKSESYQQIPFRQNSFQQTIFPILYDQQLSLQQIIIIYKVFLIPILNSFKPKYIYLDLTISSVFKIEFQGIDYLLRQLQKRANVIVYLRYKSQCSTEIHQNQNDELFNSYLNAIISGLSGFKTPKTESFYKENLEDLYNWAKQMQISYYSQNESLKKQVHLLNQKFQNLDSKYIYYDIYQFVIRLKENFIQWIYPTDFQSSGLCFTHSYCFYNQNRMVIFEQGSSSIYSEEISAVKQDQNNSQIYKIFSKFEITKRLIEPSILVLGQFLIVVYGHEQVINELQFFDGIFIFNFQELDEIQELKRDYNAPQNKEKILNCIQNRRCPQICQNNGFDSDENQLSFMLIGGESMKSNVIMNIIEIVVINLKKKTFYSYFLNNEILSLTSSLKPWPHQIVLEVSLQKIHLYLILTGNDLLKQNPFQFPKNPFYHTQSQLLVQKDNKFKLYNLNNQISEQCHFSIEQIYNTQRNWILEKQECTQSQIVWKAYLTRVVNFKNFRRCKILEKFQQQFENIKYHSIQMCVELKVLLLIEKDPQDYKVQLNWEILSLQAIEN